MRNVVILGMHRSGTSMVAGELAAAGLYVGTPAELLVAQEDNPVGFWERRDVVNLNDRLLAAAGGSWFAPPLGGLPAEYESAIVDILATLPDAQPWLLKDPRMVLTWPAWRKALGEVVQVYVYRDPCAVAVSLNRRNGFPLTLGLALWEHYNRRALDISGDYGAVAISYEAIVADPEGSLQRMLQRLSALGVACAVESSRDTYKPELTRSARHSAPLELARSLLTPSQRSLQAYCEALCMDAELPPLMPADASLQPSLDDLARSPDAVAHGLEATAELARQQQLCEERTGERDHALAQLRQLEGDYRQLVVAHKDELSRHQNLQRQQQALEQDHAALAAAHKAEVALREELEERAQYLFATLTKAYTNLLEFERSRLGAVQRFVRRAYKVLTRRRGISTSYEDALADAREYFREFELTLSDRPPGKLTLLLSVLRYMAAHPVSSLRSFSLTRLWRGLTVLRKSSPADFNVWVGSRFPQAAGPAAIPLPAELDPELDFRKLEFPDPGQPRVSIIVPVYNDYRVTMNCLVALLDHTSGVDYEVLLGDDHSSDLTATITERVRNLRVVRGEVNRGFLGNCNATASEARGDFLLFLNNDTSVCPGWLEPMLALVDAHPEVGVVGPKLLFPDGKLQEAGGIIWDDASGWNYGRADDPAKPEYNYVKPVDYVSGACLLIRRSLWLQLGGFDQRYVPAYYEDSDLCFAAREAGYQVLYQPASQVYHFEGVSNGTDLNSGVKRYQVENQQKFLAKWRQVLERDHFPNADHVFLARDRSRDQRSVLFIDHYVPHFDKDAGSRSTLMYVQLMVDMGYRVIFLGANFFPHQPYTETLQQMGVEVLVGEYSARNLDRWLQDNARYIDNVYLHRPHVAEQFLPHLEKMEPRPRIIFFGHDLHYLRVTREHQLAGEPGLQESANNWRRREFAVFDRVDRIYYPSAVEVEAIQAQRPELSVRAIPLYAMTAGSLPEYRPEPDGGLLFVGGFNHPPNVDGICWLVDEVLPLLRQAHPGVQLHIVGSNPSAAILALQAPGVTVHGYLPDDRLQSLYRRVQLAVVPLRYGAGVKGKVLEAVQQRVPLVTTPVGAEGIPEAASVMAIADTAEAFAAAVGRVLAGESEPLQRLARYADWLEAHFSAARAAAIVTEDFGSPRQQREVATRAQTQR